MKICAVICEYNPFHNGHQHQLDKIKELTDCDTILCIMSGNYTQRGEIAILDKYTRAAHAVRGGADIVIELPTVFATAPAELFAKGALHILSSIPEIKFLCFGSELGDKDAFLSTAAALLNESKEFKSLLKDELKKGKSLVKAKTDAIKSMQIENVDLNLLENPNSILGLEYTKAILSNNYPIEILPIERVGRGYNDTALHKKFSSASGIRAALLRGKKRFVKKTVPRFTYKDLSASLPNADDFIYYSLLTRSASEVSEIIDCTEGLENRIKALIKDNLSLQELTDKVVTKRYTRARIRRIFLSNFLNIKAPLVQKCLKSRLYLKVLAISNERLDILSDLKQNTPLPLLTRKSDNRLLDTFQSDCFNKDVESMDIYNFISGTKNNEFNMPIIDINN